MTFPVEVFDRAEARALVPSVRLQRVADARAGGPSPAPTSLFEVWSLSGGYPPTRPAALPGTI